MFRSALLVLVLGGVATADPCPPITAPPPVAATAAPTPQDLARLYIAVGTHLKEHGDQSLWQRFRLIQIQDAMLVAERRIATAETLEQIDRALALL